MKYWIISDTHYNHRKMVDVWKQRPANFEEQITKSLSAIPSEDVLIHLGDICMGKDRDMHEKYIMPLKCKKWLVRGNHDNESDGWYLRHGWDFVADAMIQWRAGKRILFTHKPMRDGGWFDVNIHGHLHGSGHRETEYAGQLKEKHKLVALETMGYQAFLLDKLLSSYEN